MDKMCTVYKTMDYLSKRWTVLILHEMSKGAEWKRFSEIERSMKEVTAKVLTERLRELEAEGLIERRVDTSCVPIKSEYRLTEASKELMDVIHELKTWALKWKIDNPVCANTQCRLCTLRSPSRQPQASSPADSGPLDFPQNRFLSMNAVQTAEATSLPSSDVTRTS